MDAARLQQWYEAYAYAVHRRCSRLLGHEADAHDVTHEVFLRAARHAHTLRGEAVLPWLYAIADRQCFELLRRKGRFVRPEDPGDPEGSSPERAPPHHEPLAEPERQRLVAQVLAACKERVRDAATLYFVDELTQDEVADALGCSRKTVKEKLAQFREVAARLLGGGERPA